MSSPAALAIHGELTLDTGSGPPSRVRAEGERVVVDLADLRAARALLAGAPRGLRAGLGSALRVADLALEVRVRGWRVATVDGRRGSWLASRLGFAGARPDWLGLALSALVRERSAPR